MKSKWKGEDDESSDPVVRRYPLRLSIAFLNLSTQERLGSLVFRRGVRGRKEARARCTAPQKERDDQAEDSRERGRKGCARGRRGV